VHLALVAAAGSPRITCAHAQLSDELGLLLLHARPRYAPGELVRQHRALLADVQRLGAGPVRAHLADTIERLGAAEGTTRGTPAGAHPAHRAEGARP
jgi:DNA-binding GntR family transcriptional regulator